MGWTAPKDWTTGQIVTEADLDTHVRDNLRYLKGLDGEVVIESNIGISPSTVLGTSVSNIIPGLYSSYNVNGNTMFERNWARRATAGGGWGTARLHNAIGVDGAFGTPGTNTRTWMERDPNAGMFLWGDQAATWAALVGGKLGLGTTAPQGRVHAAGINHGGCLFYDIDTNGNAAGVFSVLPAGSVSATLTCTFAVKPSSGTAVGGTIGSAIKPGDSPAALYSNGSSEAFSIRVNANGSVDVLRTSGSLSYKVSLWIIYL